MKLAVMLPVFFGWLVTFAEASIVMGNGRRFDPLDKLIWERRSGGARDASMWESIASEAARQYSPVYLGSQDGLMEEDKIVELPGQPAGVNFNHYAGYVTVEPKNGRALFYYFAESPVDAATKPLVLWLNGGPGCSSLGYGAMLELGPFRVNSDGKSLQSNIHAWNNVANVIFLESPAGVGFSYSNTTTDYVSSGDRRTAQDSYTFLVNWLERFPQYKDRDFYIAGESYAGHYVPQLAQTILQNNKITNQTVIKLRSISIGNPLIDRETNRKGTYDFLWTHALMSDEIHQGLSLNCNFSSEGPQSDACLSFRQKGGTEVGNVDRYNIYASLCNSSANSPTDGIFDPCSSDYVASYLNLPEVQKALHVVDVPHTWEACSVEVGWNWTDSPATVLPVIQGLMSSGIKVWIYSLLPHNDSVLTVLPTVNQVIASGIRVWKYSGDVDAVCPVTATRYSVNKLGLPTDNSWRPWYSNNEVGGYVVGYKGLALVTVRGAGHLVPSYQPERALTMISSFLQGVLPPSS